MPRKKSVPKVAITQQRDFDSDYNKYRENYEKYEISDDRILTELCTESDTLAFLAHNAFSYARITDEKVVRELIKEAQSGNRQALEKLWCANLRIPFFLLAKYINPKAEKEDLIQEGNIAIEKAILKFDLSKTDIKFSTVAFRFVINQFHYYFYKINPKRSTAPPSPKLRKYISTTELFNLVNNFTDERDLRQRIAYIHPKGQEMIIDFVLKRILTIISFEECEDEILEEIHTDTSREFCYEDNYLYMFEMERFYKLFRSCALERFTRKSFEMYCEMNGLFGYPPVYDRQKILEKYNVTLNTFQNLSLNMIEKVFENEEYHDYLKAIINKVIEARSYFYEKI